MEKELYHHGVVGMKWGVRHEVKRYNSARSNHDYAGEAKARASLEKRRDKINVKLGKLDKKEQKLSKRLDRYERKSELRAQRLETQSARYAKKAGRSWSRMRRNHLYRKSDNLRYDAQTIRLRGAKHKAGLRKVQHLKEQYNKGLITVNDTLSNSGRQYVSKMRGR